MVGRPGYKIENKASGEASLGMAGEGGAAHVGDVDRMYQYPASAWLGRVNPCQSKHHALRVVETGFRKPG